MTGWIAGLKMSPDRFAEDFFGSRADSPVAMRLREAAEKVAAAGTNREIQAASDAVAAGMQAVGLDRWRRFLVDAAERVHANGIATSAGPSGTITAVTENNTGAVPAAGDNGAAERKARIVKLVSAGAAATQADVDAVVAYMMRTVPDDVLKLMEKDKITVRVTRGSVAAELGVSESSKPRGWETQTMGAVPAIYDQGRRRVVIATQDDGNGGRRVPNSKEQGSVSVVLHEIGHGIDDNTSIWTNPANTDTFKDAYAADANHGPLSIAYYHQDRDGRAGRSEAFAEAFAMYNADSARMSIEYPILYHYFQIFMQKELE